MKMKNVTTAFAIGVGTFSVQLALRAETVQKPESVEYVQACVAAIEANRDILSSINSCEDPRLSLGKPSTVSTTVVDHLRKGKFKIILNQQDGMQVGFIDNHLWAAQGPTYLSPSSTTNRQPTPAATSRAVTCTSGGFFVWTWTTCESSNLVCQWNGDTLVRCLPK